MSKDEPSMQPHEPYDPETRLEPDEKILLAHLKAGNIKSSTLGPDGKMYDDDGNIEVE